MDGDRIRRALTAIDAAVDDLHDAALWTLTAPQLLEETRACHVVLQRLEAVYAGMAAELDGRELDHGLTAKAFLRTALRRTTGQAAADVRASTGLLPRCMAAFAAGEVSRAHIDVITKTLDQISTETRYREVPRHLPELRGAADEPVTILEAFDAYFAGWAPKYTSTQIQYMARALLAALAPDEDDGFDEDAHERRGETHARGDNGMLYSQMNLDAATGAAFAAAVDHFSAPRPSRKEQADDGTVVEVKDTRSPAQRRADAVGLISRLAMGAADAGTKGGEPPRIVLYTGVEDYADLHCADPTHTHTHTHQPTPVPQPPPAKPPAPQPLVAEPPAPQPPVAEPPAPQPPVAEPPAPQPPVAEPPTTQPHAPEHAAAEQRVPEPAAGVQSGPAFRPPADSGDDSEVSPGECRRGAAFRGRVHGATDTHLGAIGPRLLARFACDAVLQVALMHPAGAVLDLGRDTRTITPAQRRALTARDRGCVIPGCTAPAAWCEGHHVTWWEKGGLTDLDNLALVCSEHHTAVHLGLWDLRMINGVPWARASWNLDPLQRWIRNTFHDDLDIARGFGAQMRLDMPMNDPPSRPVDEPDDRPPPPDTT